MSADKYLLNLKELVFGWITEYHEVQRAASPEAEAERRAAELRAQLIAIKAKEECSCGEAALLLNVSETKVRDYIKNTKKKRLHPPFPFTEYPGPILVISVSELLAWKASCRQGRARGLRVVKEADAA